MKLACLLASADYGNQRGHRLCNQNQETKNYFVILLVCCVSFSCKKFLVWVANKPTKNFKITVDSKLALGVQQKLGLLEQQTRLAMEFISMQPANFPSNRNVALHARSLVLPWARYFLLIERFTFIQLNYTPERWKIYVISFQQDKWRVFS